MACEGAWWLTRVAVARVAWLACSRWLAVARSGSQWLAVARGGSRWREVARSGVHLGGLRLRRGGSRLTGAGWLTVVVGGWLGLGYYSGGLEARGGWVVQQSSVACGGGLVAFRAWVAHYSGGSLARCGSLWLAVARCGSRGSVARGSSKVLNQARKAPKPAGPAQARTNPYAPARPLAWRETFLRGSLWWLGGLRALGG